MPLKLVTGPANAGKARIVLDAYRAALERGGEPILVVPTHADVERYRRELAGAGVVFGARVVRFEWLIGEIAARAGVHGRPLSTLAREQVAASVIATTRLTALAASAETGGFARALLRFVDELEQSRVTPQRLTQALRAWAAEAPGRRAYAEEVTGLYVGYRRRLQRLGRRDAPLHAVAALDGVREDPAAWGDTPVFFYGFDDLTALQRDAVETLARTAAQITLSLAYEAGRMAFAGRATTFAELRHDGVEHVELKSRAEHYAPASRAALHQLERELFELPDAGRLFEPDPVASGAALTLMQGGGERAELELVAAEVARLIAEEGFDPHEIAVVLRDPRPLQALLVEVFAARGVAVAIDRRTAFGHTALGRGLVALLRCALLDGAVDDLLAWLRTPGVLRRSQLADRLEARARQTGARSAAQARELWEAEHWTLAAIDRVRAAWERGGAELLDQLSDELAVLFAAPRRRGAEVLTGPVAQDGHVMTVGRRALDELLSLAAVDGTLAPTPAQLAALLEDLEVRDPTEQAAGRVTVSEPLALRARRVRALFACALQEGVFPARPGAEPFFADSERAAIEQASGLRLRRRDDLGAERYLFYATVSRPEERLYLSWHEADDDGEPAVPSFFVSDVCDLFGAELWQRRRLRTLGQVERPAGAVPTARELLREQAAGGPRHREAPISALTDAALVSALRERPTWSASAIELWAGCPVRWFVERRLDPEGLTPDPELLLRGQLTHAALEATLSGLREQTGSARIEAATLDRARALATAALEDLRRDPRMLMSRDQSRQRALSHRMRADLLRYLEHAAADGSALEPSLLEVVFGADDGGNAHPALELAGGVRIGGRIDRIDTGPDGEAIVYDYKGRNPPDPGGWRRDRRYQMALYMLFARQRLGLDAVGGLYQPIGGRDPRPRGAVLRDADPGLVLVATDRREREQLDELLDGVLDDVLGAVGELRSGALAPRPESCAYSGGCAYPTICRCAAA
ncbi:MAG: PD-(D/E)XK nuclease family protein [Solirubrobacteraceae bacterium]